MAVNAGTDRPRLPKQSGAGVARKRTGQDEVDSDCLFANQLIVLVSNSFSSSEPFHAASAVTRVHQSQILTQGHSSNRVRGRFFWRYKSPGQGEQNSRHHSHKRPSFFAGWPRKSGAFGGADFFRGQASRQTSTMNFGYIPEGRSENRRALQRRLLPICNRPRPGGPG
jgi:hypothetical protein